MKGPNTKLFLIFLIVLAGTVLAVFLQRRTTELSYAEEMHRATQLAQKWFNIIDSVKSSHSIHSTSHSIVPNHQMIGDDWSDITTTLGSLEAKEISSNPEFAALTVRLLNEAGIENGDTIGIILSGSFPALSVSVLAAIQTMELEAELISSLGASTFGANQPEATWLDLETWLRRKGGMKYKSKVTSMGAGQDNGNGLTEEGKKLLKVAFVRNHTDLYLPESISESINYKTKLLRDNHIKLLINIGGNMAALGNCPHSLNIPNGLNYSMHTCSDSLRGIIPRFFEQGIPVIHFLNIKELAATYGMDIAPGKKYSKSVYLFSKPNPDKIIYAVILLCCLIPIAFLRKK